MRKAMDDPWFAHRQGKRKSGKKVKRNACGGDVDTFAALRTRHLSAYEQMTYALLACSSTRQSVGRADEEYVDCVK